MNTGDDEQMWVATAWVVSETVTGRQGCKCDQEIGRWHNHYHCLEFGTTTTTGNYVMVGIWYNDWHVIQTHELLSRVKSSLILVQVQ